jgi:hypothetical protein
MELDGNDYSAHSWQKVVSLDLPTTTCIHTPVPYFWPIGSPEGHKREQKLGQLVYERLFSVRLLSARAWGFIQIHDRRYLAVCRRA